MSILVKEEKVPQIGAFFADTLERAPIGDYFLPRFAEGATAMIKISKKADYAVIIMAALAIRQRDEEALRGEAVVHEVSPRSAMEVADDNRLSRPVCANLLKALTRANLLESVRGAGGGYRLAVSRSDINLAQILEAVEGPMRLVQCVGTDHDHSDCTLIGHCVSRDAMRIVHERLANLMSHILLPELIDQHDPARLTNTIAAIQARP